MDSISLRIRGIKIGIWVMQANGYPELVHQDGKMLSVSCIS